jgi:hypothetical protein
MRKVLWASLLGLPLLSGWQPDEPLAPELKGRWAVPPCGTRA